MNRIVVIALAAPLLAMAVPPRGAGEPEPEAPADVLLLDAQGRRLVPGGFVVLPGLPYTPDDYRRMVRMGANFQVIRVPLGELGGWPGTAPDPAGLERLDALVRMGRDAGLQTVFKMVVYGIRPFGPAQWDALWRNADGCQETLLAAWRTLWTRYRDDPSVFGYDLLNEPQRGLDPDYDRCLREGLLPLLRRLADAMHAVSPGKWALYQPLFLNGEDRVKGVNPFVPMTEPFGHDRVIYAPHLYHMDLPLMERTLEAYAREAARSRAPLLLGEWGPATPVAADADPKRQAVFTRTYRATADAMDRRGIGAIKAWFCGSARPLTSKARPEPFTWAIFSDNDPVGRVERRYIVDAIVRPRPLAVAGRLERFGTDFETMCFSMALETDPALGATELFVPAERHYPRGFRLELGEGLALALDPGAAAFRVVRAAEPADREQAARVRWDGDLQRVTIARWTGPARRLTVSILPGASE